MQYDFVHQSTMISDLETEENIHSYSSYHHQQQQQPQPQQKYGDFSFVN